MAMDLSSGVSHRFNSLISALDAAHIDNYKISFDLVQSQSHQIEKLHAQRDHDALKASKSAALLIEEPLKLNRDSSTKMCVHCGNHLKSVALSKKFLHFAPVGHFTLVRLDNASIGGKRLVVSLKSIIDEEFKALIPKVRLTGMILITLKPDLFRTAVVSRVPDVQSIFPNRRGIKYRILTNQFQIIVLVIDSGSTSHLRHSRSNFTTFNLSSVPSPLNTETDSSAPVKGSADVIPTI